MNISQNLILGLEIIGGGLLGIAIGALLCSVLAPVFEWFLDKIF